MVDNDPPREDQAGFGSWRDGTPKATQNLPRTTPEKSQVSNPGVETNLPLTLRSSDLDEFARLASCSSHHSSPAARSLKRHHCAERITSTDQDLASTPIPLRAGISRSPKADRAASSSNVNSGKGVLTTHSIGTTTADPFRLGNAPR